MQDTRLISQSESVLLPCIRIGGKIGGPFVPITRTHRHAARNKRNVVFTYEGMVAFPFDRFTVYAHLQTSNNKRQVTSTINQTGRMDSKHQQESCDSASECSCCSRLKVFAVSVPLACPLVSICLEQGGFRGKTAHTTLRTGFKQTASRSV